MKLIIFIALIASAASVPIEDKNTKPIDGANKETAADEKKPEEKKGLQWPLPDPDDEGDLMLHGDYLFDRLETLRKGKVEKEEDKMILSVGRQFLRRVHEYIENVTDFKFPSILCRDSDRINSTDRWEIRQRPKNQRSSIDISNYITIPLYFGDSTDDQPEKVQIVKREQNDVNQTIDDPIVPSNSSTHDNVTVAPKDQPKFGVLQKEYNKRLGDNFTRLLMKRYRKEKLEREEIDYLARWLSDESIHYGMMGIYCDDGENLEDIKKRIRVLIEEKQ